MTDRYENIRAALAMGATPGPWQAEGGEIWAARPIRFNATTAGTPLVARTERHPCTEGGFPWEANAALIAACDPDTIRALLEERDALREALAKAEGRTNG